jgi:hypothetical protein
VGTPTQWFNPAAFVLPPAGTYGNAGRDILTGPGLTEFDMSLFKTTAISERINVQFRAECFNLLNHPNFGMPVVSTFSSGAVSPTAGVITYTTTTQREIQFGLKLCESADGRRQNRHQPSKRDTPEIAAHRLT